MKVCQIMFSGLGGHGSVVFSLINASQQEWNNSLIFIGNEEVKTDYYDYCQNKQIKSLFVDIRLHSRLAGWFCVYKSLREINPNQVILHSISYIIPVSLFCFITRSKLITVEHTPSNKKRKIDFLFSAISHLTSHYIVLLTQDFANKLKKKIKFFYRSKKIKIISNGIDIKKFIPCKIPAKASQNLIKIGMAARFSKEKLQYILIDALKILYDKGFKNIQLSLAGSGETLDYNKIKSNDLYLDQNIIFEGMLNENELVHWFQELDIYLHASSSETMCTTVLQAMACAKPIIASNISGINDVLDKKSSILVNNNANKFASAILKFIKDKQMQVKFGESGREYCMNNYTNKSMFDQYNKLVQEK